MIMDKVYIIIVSKGSVWGNLFFTSQELARNYIKMRVPASHTLVEVSEGKFVAKRYGSQYRISTLRDFTAEQKRIADEGN